MRLALLILAATAGASVAAAWDSHVELVRLVAREIMLVIGLAALVAGIGLLGAALVGALS